MKINISLDEVKRIAAEGDYDIVPICSELLSDIKTPVQVLRSLMNVCLRALRTMSDGDAIHSLGLNLSLS